MVLFLLLLFLPAYSENENFESQLSKLPEKKRLVLLNRALKNPESFPAATYRKYAEYTLYLARKTGYRQEEARALLNMGHVSYFRKNNEQALDYYFQSREIAKEIRSWRQIADADKEISNMFSFVYFDYPNALYYYQKVLNLTKERGKPEDLISPLNNIAVIYHHMGDWTRTLEYLLQSLEIAEKSGEADRLAVLLLNLSEIYLVLGNDEQFLAVIRRVEDILKEINHTSIHARMNSWQGKWHQKKGEYAAAISFFEKALAGQRLCENQGKIAEELFNLGWTYYLKGEIDKARQFLHESLSICHSEKNQPGIAETVLALGKIHEASGNLKEAMRLFTESLQICRDKNLKKLTIDVYKAFSVLSNKTGHPAEALKFNQDAAALQESLLGPQITGPIMSLLMKYEKEKYGQQIKKRRNLVTYASILVIILLMALLFVLRSQRQRARNTIRSYEQLVTSQQLQLKKMESDLQEIEAQKEPKKYEKSKLTLEKARDCLKKLVSLMTEEKIYLDPEMNLKSLSESLGVNTTYLSQIINEHLGKNFADYINQFRVEEVKRLLLDQPQADLSLTDVAFQAGFNSIPSFNRIFKKWTGLSPSQFVRHASAMDQRQK